MSSTESVEGGNKKEKKKARKALMLFLKRLRRACEVIETADDWSGIVEDLDGLLAAHQLGIPFVSRQRLQSASTLASPTLTGVGRACDLLQLEVERAIKGLPAGGGGAGLAIVGAVIAVAVVVAGVVIAVNLRSVEVVIRNEGCGTISLLGSQLPIVEDVINTVGIELPDRIPTGGQESLRMPGLKIEIDATEGSTAYLTIAGFRVPLELGHNVTSLELDGRPLLGRRTQVNLRELRQHELVVRCG